MDDVDRGQEREQELREAALEEHARRSARERELLPIGTCHWRGEGVRGSALFCPLDPRLPGESCAADWQRDHDARMRNGG